MLYDFFGSIVKYDYVVDHFKQRVDDAVGVNSVFILRNVPSEPVLLGRAVAVADRIKNG